MADELYQGNFLGQYDGMAPVPEEKPTFGQFVESKCEESFFMAAYRLWNTPDYENSYFFKHNSKKTEFDYNLENLKEDEILSSKSTAASIIHIAAYMGAKNIILCGHDCGRLYGDMYYDGYMESDWISSENWPGIDSHTSKIEIETQKLRLYLMETYDCNIHSLNPFLNFGLEGHKFVKS